MNVSPIVLLLGGLAVWYLPTALALKKLDVRLSSFSLERIETDYIDISLTLSALNKSTIALTFNSLRGNLQFDGVVVSQFAHSGYNISVPAGQIRDITLLVRLDKNVMKDTVWSTLINKGFKNSTVLLSCNAQVNNRPYKFSDALKLGKQ